MFSGHIWFDSKLTFQLLLSELFLLALLDEQPQVPKPANEARDARYQTSSDLLSLP